MLLILIFVMQKRGEGITFNAIIIAALCLVVLIVLLMIFSGKMNLFARSTECAARNGECLAQHSEWNGGCPSDKPISIMSDDCHLIKEGVPTNEKPGQCCIPLG